MNLNTYLKLIPYQRVCVLLTQARCVRDTAEAVGPVDDLGVGGEDGFRVGDFVVYHRDSDLVRENERLREALRHYQNHPPPHPAGQLGGSMECENL